MRARSARRGDEGLAGYNIYDDLAAYYETGVLQSRRSHHEGGRWEKFRLLCLSCETRRIIEAQGLRTKLTILKGGMDCG